MTDYQNLTTMSDGDLESLSRAVAAELAARRTASAPAEPEMRQIKCREKSLNAKGNGSQVTRRVRLPNGRSGWASDLAQDLTGSWSSGTFLAADRNCAERGKFPIGTIVLEFTSSFSHGQKSGSASMTAGVIVSKTDDDKSPVKWGLSTKGRGSDVQVKTPDGEWVTV